MHNPIDNLNSNEMLDSIIFIEEDGRAAAKTRAAACMYIYRNDYDLTTMVRGNEIYIRKDKDYEGSYEYISC